MGKISQNSTQKFGKVSETARTRIGKIGLKYGKRDQPRYASALEYKLKQEIKPGSENENYIRTVGKLDKKPKKRLETGAPIEPVPTKAPPKVKVVPIEVQTKPTWEATSEAEISITLPEPETKIGRPPKSKISEELEGFTGSKISKNPTLNKLTELFQRNQ